MCLGLVKIKLAGPPGYNQHHKVELEAGHYWCTADGSSPSLLFGTGETAPGAPCPV